MKRKFNIGFIINPFAGIGGKVGLKGSDGAEIREEAFARGAVAQAEKRAAMALKILAPYVGSIEFTTVSGAMGANLLSQFQFSYEVIHKCSEPSNIEDTLTAAELMCKASVDVLLFAGGDGTARNIYQACESSLFQSPPVLGIPAGVKIHSGVYAITPVAAGMVIEKMIKNELVSLVETSVMDIDEEAFRAGRVRARQYGELMVPAEHRFVQATKDGGKEIEALVLQDIADYLIELMEDSADDSVDGDEQAHYLIGSGTTCAGVMERMSLENSLLGIDWVHEQQLIQTDMTESDILALLEKHEGRVKLVITVIGGQGHIIGRGNQQISADVLRKLGRENIIIIATKTKIQALEGKPLIIDSDDQLVNDAFSGLIPVITGYDDRILYPVGLEQE